MTDVRIVDDQSKLWAQEYTLLRLVDNSTFTNDILLKFAKQYLKSYDIDKLGERTTAAADKNADELGRTIKETGEKSDLETSMAAKRYEYAVTNLKDSLLSGLGDIGNSLSVADPGSIFGVLNNRLDSANRSFEGANTSLSRMIGTLAIFAKVLDISYQRINQLNDGYVSAYSSGVKFADGLSGLNAVVGESGMSMQDYIGIMTKYSQAFNVLGGRRVPELSREFRTLTNNGSSLTMTLAQSQEGLMAYTDILRMSGRLQRMTNKDIAVGAKSYLESINELSYASGRSREELMASTRNALARPEFQAFMSTLNDGAKANLEKSITSLAAFGDEMQSKMSSFIEAGMSGGTAAMFKNNESLFMLAQQTGQIPQMMKIIEMAAAGQDITQAMIEFSSGIENSTLASSGQLARLAQFDPMFAGMQQEFGKLLIETNTLKDAQKQLAEEAAAAGVSIEEYKAAQTRQSDRMSEANSKMQIAMTSLNSAFNELILDLVYPVLIPGMHALSAIVWGLSKVLSVLMTPFTALADLVTSITAPVVGDNVGGLLGVGAGAALGYGAYRGAKRLLGGRGTPGVDPMDMLEGPEPPDMGKKSRIGRMLSGLGGGVGGAGSGSQGVMTGIAEGFKSFANPRVAAGMLVIAGGLAATGFALSQFADVEWDDMAKAGVTIGALALPILFASKAISKIPPTVVLGSGYLATAIGLLGAGIAGAAWLLGSTLPTLAEGVNAFSAIDGANLEKVGLGMIGVGAGLLAIGAGEVGFAVGGLISWVGKLFGAEDPIDKLKRFGELGEPLGKAGPALDAFGTAFLNATAKMNVATLNDSVETSMEQIMSILNMDASGTFGGEPPIIGQINSLADAIGKLNRESADIAMGTAGSSASVTSPDMLSPSDLQKRTLAFYDNQRTSNANIIELLRMQNDKLDTLNTSVVDDTNRTVRALKQGSNVVN
jgi:hypothetical protein